VVMHMSAVAAVISMMLIARSDAWPAPPSVLCITMVFSMLTRETMTGINKGEEDVGGELMYLKRVIIGLGPKHNAVNARWETGYTHHSVIFSLADFQTGRKCFTAPGYTTHQLGVY